MESSLDLGWVAAWLVLAIVGSAAIAQFELGRLRESFEVDAHIMHRLLSQRTVQHDAVLATLNLLQSQSSEGERRLSSVYPQMTAIEGLPTKNGTCSRVSYTKVVGVSNFLSNSPQTVNHLQWLLQEVFQPPIFLGSKFSLGA